MEKVVISSQRGGIAVELLNPTRNLPRLVHDNRLYSHRAIYDTFQTFSNRNAND